MTLKLIKTFAMAFAFAALPTAHAAELKGVKFADTLTVGTKNLVLNGLGLRQATFLKVNVYVGALYLETQDTDAAKIAASSGVKRIELAFLRDVGADKIKEAWSEGFEKNCLDQCDTAKAGIEKLQAASTEMKKGDKMTFTFLPDTVEVAVKDQKPVAINVPHFSKNLLLVWLGKNPPNSELKEGMLKKVSASNN